MQQGQTTGCIRKHVTLLMEQTIISRLTYMIRDSTDCKGISYKIDDKCVNKFRFCNIPNYNGYAGTYLLLLNKEWKCHPHLLAVASRLSYT